MTFIILKCNGTKPTSTTKITQRHKNPSLSFLQLQTKNTYRVWIELLYIVNVYYLLTQRSGLKFIRFLFPLPLPRFEESTEGRKFTFSFQGRRSRTWTQTVCPQSSTILLFRCNEKKNNVIYNLLHIFFIYVEQIKYLFLLNWYSVIKLFKK